MKARVKVKEPATRRVVDNSSKARTISPEEVAHALGAVPSSYELPPNLPLEAHLGLYAQSRQRCSRGGAVDVRCADNLADHR